LPKFIIIIIIIITTTISGLIARTYKIPLLRFKVIAKIAGITHSNVEHQTVGHTPRKKNKLAYLNVKRKPCDVDATMSHTPIVARIPGASAVVTNPHVFGLRCNFIFVNQLCTTINNNQSINQFI